MTTIYIEADDEITTAIGRIRAVTGYRRDPRCSGGSKIATSRINFKLLAREAAERRMNVVAVSDEPQVRALAIRRGCLHTTRYRPPNRHWRPFATRTEAQRADPPDDAARASELREASTNTQVLPPRSLPVPRRSPSIRPFFPLRSRQMGRSRPRKKRRIPIAPLLVLGLVVVLLAGVAYGAYVFLPTAR